MKKAESTYNVNLTPSVYRKIKIFWDTNFNSTFVEHLRSNPELRIVHRTVVIQEEELIIGMASQK